MIQLRQTVRRLSRTLGFTLIVVLTLAIGIGATTAIFSVVNGILIKPLPYPDADRLIALRHQSPGDDNRAASAALYFTYRDYNEAFESVALWFADTATIRGTGGPEEVRSLVVTHEFLPTLDVRPAVGRAFSAGDDQVGSPRTVILSHDYWQRRFGGAANAIGENLLVDGEPHAVIGVLPRSFRFSRQQADVLTPMQPSRAIAVFGPTGEQGIARLKEGVTLEEASADVARMVPIAREQFPLPGNEGAEAPTRFGPNLEYLKDNVVGNLDDVLWVLMGTIGMLLAVACANLANLQLVRTEGRGRELAIRAALGAGWGAIAATLLLETTLLGLAGGAAGLGLAAVGLPILLAAAAEHLPSVLEVTIDLTVLVFTLAISLAAGIAFGLVPVVKCAGPRIAAALQGGGRAYSTTRDANKTRNVLVIAQVALALILLVAAGLMIRSFESLRNVEPGFAQPEQVQTVTLSIPEGSVPEFDRVIRMQNDIQDRLSDVSGVESLGFASMVPLGGDGPDGGFLLEDREPVSAEFRFTSPGFFQTLRTPLVAGRDFAWTDYYDGESSEAVVISESLARREWGAPAAAVGKRMRRTPASPWAEVVGVVGDVHLEGVDIEAPDTVYVTLRDGLAQWMSRTVTFVMRSERVGTGGFLEDIQEAVWSVEPTLPLASVRTMDDLYRQSMARTSLTLVLLAITGGMALLLGLVGIYAVISHMLTRRTREIGLRMALGAHSAGLQRMLLRRVLGLVAVGVALGLGGAAAVTRLMESLLFGVTSLDAATYAAVAVALALAGAVAGYLPARRVTGIDPMQALREE